DMCIHWPVVILYPANGQSDFVEDWHEAVPFGDMLASLLPDDGPAAPWDTEGKYRKSKVDVYYQKRFVKPLPLDEVWIDADGFTPASSSGGSDGDKTVEMVKVPMDAPLMAPVTAEDYVVPDVPVFFVVVRGSPFAISWEAKYGPIKTLPLPKA
ncbi:ttc4, partial [Symbiodinium sp. KB8]